MPIKCLVHNMKYLANAWLPAAKDCSRTGVSHHFPLVPISNIPIISPLWMPDFGDMMGIFWGYTLWLCQNSYWNGHRNSEFSPIQNGGSFHSFLYVYQRLSLFWRSPKQLQLNELAPPVVVAPCPVPSHRFDALELLMTGYWSPLVWICLAQAWATAISVGSLSTF